MNKMKIDRSYQFCMFCGGYFHDESCIDYALQFLRANSFTIDKNYYGEYYIAAYNYESIFGIKIEDIRVIMNIEKIFRIFRGCELDDDQTIELAHNVKKIMDKPYLMTLI